MTTTRIPKLVLAAAVAALFQSCSGERSGPQPAATAAPGEHAGHDAPLDQRLEKLPPPAEAQQMWTCSMHPHIRLPGPGKCPICGMDLVPAAPAPAGRTAVETEAVTRRRVRLYRPPCGRSWQLPP